jgi:glycosyltransferase involved in cell wall biosynthesis
VNTAKVSFLVGCYNHSDYVIECLDSIKNQSYKNIEIIIWDDCSSDDSANKINQWILNEKKLINCSFIENNKNIGLCRSLNKALEKVSGKYIAITSADDMQLPDRIERHVKILDESSENTGVVYADAINVDKYGRSLNSRVLDYFSYKKYPSGNVFEDIFDEKFIPPSMATLTKKKCYDSVGCYDESLPIEDYDMWLRISNSYDFIYDPIPGAKYRTVDLSMSRNPENYKRISNACKESRVKCLSYTLLNKIQKKTVVNDIMDLCKYAYSNGVTPKYVLRKKLLASVFSINPKEIIFAIFVILGVPPKIYYRIHSTLRKKA